MEACLRHLSRRGAKAASAFHYFNLYQCCPRKFYFKYFKRWIPKHVHPALVQGSAFHEGKATFYTSKARTLESRERQAITKALDVLDESREELENEQTYKDIGYRLPNMLHFWIQEVGRFDLNNYKFLAVEKQLKVPISGTPYEMTVRQDAIGQDKQNGLIYIFETKTSGFSHRLTSEAVFYGDQATAYIWAARKALKLDVFGVIPDISYWNKNSVDVKNIQNIRGDIVQRSEFALNAFERMTAQILTEINQKAQAYKKGYDPFILFPRNCYYCLSYSSKCDYAPFCYDDVEKIKTPPSELKLDKGIRKITRKIDDQIGIL